MLRSIFIAVLLSLTAASPSAIQKRSFKVDRVPNDKYTGKNGPQALAKALRKFGMPVPNELDAAAAARNSIVSSRHLEKHTIQPGKYRAGGARSRKKSHGKGNDNDNGGNGATTVVVIVGASGNQGAVDTGGAATNQSGQVAANPEPNDSEFLSPIKIGGQTLTLDFDTGSSDLWVFSTQLASEVSAGHGVFAADASKTFTAMPGAQFLITYGDGSGATGIVGTDVVDVGGASFDAQAIELATDVSEQFVADQNNDGLMGLAFSSINTVQPQQQKTFFDNIMNQLDEPVFTADLRRNASGAYEFGTIDTAKFQGDLTWVPVNSSQGFWQFSSESFAVGGGKAQAAAKGGQAIADTGTTLILADPSIVQGYYSQIAGAKNDQQAGGVTVPCNATLPDLDLDIGGAYMARIQGADLNFASVDGTNCFGGLQATQEGGLGVYGDIMFKSQFVAFNGGNISLGLAPHA